MGLKAAIFSFLVTVIAACAIAQTGVTPGLSTQDFIVYANHSPPASTLPGRRTPSATEATEAKTALLDYLSSDRGTEKGRPDMGAEQGRRIARGEISDYSLQYVGAHGTWSSNGGGKPDPSGGQVVIIHGFCRVPPGWLDRLREQELIIMDGGPCYFSGYYSLSERKIVWFYRNHR